MTEQPPSASKEALDIIDGLRIFPGPGVISEDSRDDGADAIDALCEQRVSAETEWCAQIDRQRLEQIDRLQETVQSFQIAQDERPDPEGAILKIEDWTECTCPKCGRLHWKTHERPAPEQPASPPAVVDYAEQPQAGREVVPHSSSERRDKTQPLPLGGGDAPVAQMAEAQGLNPGQCQLESDPEHQPSTRVADYTERAREIVRKSTFVYGSSIDGEPNHSWIDATTAQKEIAAALSAAASEHDAAAIRAFGERVWSDTEDVAYQAGAMDERAALLGRLREPDVREAVIDALMTTTGWVSSFPGKLPLVSAALADAALTKIAEMLK